MGFIIAGTFNLHSNMSNVGEISRLLILFRAFRQSGYDALLNIKSSSALENIMATEKVSLLNI